MADADMADLRDTLIDRAKALAKAHGLGVTFSQHDRFAACSNDPEATAVVLSALEALRLPHGDRGLPMRASEDFGLFGSVSRSAMFLLGSGERSPALHNPDYDFPDTIIPAGVAIFDRIRRDLLG
jgi:metal-dependent amidase/aminoacylase/carboxypeptidase family protein